MHVDQATQTARIQALGVFPFLTERILLNGYADIRSAIDARIPLAQALAERFKLPVAMVRKLSRFPAAKLGRHLSKPDILWPLFAKVALERIPSTDEQWIEFELLTQRIYGFTRQPINTELNTDILTQCLSSRLTARVLLGDGWRENQMLLRHFLDAAIGIDIYKLTIETGFTQGFTEAFNKSKFYGFDSKYSGYYITIGVLLGKAKTSDDEDDKKDKKKNDD